jgi:hypothetical protein
MFKKAYIINYEKGGVFDNFDYKKFHNTLTTANGILNWWHYLGSSYIIITENNITATNVSEFVKQYMKNKLFLVVELNLQNHSGWLPKEAWEWINKNTL